MLKIRVIPVILWKDYGVYKGRNFDSWRRIGSVHSTLKVFNNRMVDELILLNISGSLTKTDLDYEIVSEFSADCTVPLTVGGGIRNIEEVELLLHAGADKVSINSILYENLNFLYEVSSRFGRQCVTASIDVRRIDNKTWICYANSALTKTEKEVKNWAIELESQGAGEILLTSIDRDGCMQGYDLDLISIVTESVSIPVIASGGAGAYSHFVEAVKVGGASAVAAGSMFNFTEQTPLEAKKYMERFGVPVRITNESNRL